MRLLDLLRRLRGRRQPGRAPEAALGAELRSRPNGRGPGRRTGASSTTGRPPTRTGKPWSERKKLVWWDADEQKWTGVDVPDFEEDKPPDYEPARRRGGRARDRRRPPVHHASRRPQLALRPAGPRGRAAADALRAARVAVRQSALRATREPARQQKDEPRESVQPGRRRAGRDLSVRRHHLPADGAPHRGRHDALRALPRRAAAGDVRRGHPELARRKGSCTAAGRRSTPRARRSRRACSSPTACKPLTVDGPQDAPGRPAVPLGLARPHDRRRRRTTSSSLALDPNVHIQEVEGVRRRHPAGPPAARSALTEFVETATRRGSARPRPEPRSAT